MSLKHRLDFVASRLSKLLDGTVIQLHKSSTGSLKIPGEKLGVRMDMPLSRWAILNFLIKNMQWLVLVFLKQNHFRLKLMHPPVTRTQLNVLILPYYSICSMLQCYRFDLKVIHCFFWF